MKGDAGEDVLKGGGGSDRLHAEDGEPDVVRCGSGRRDRARIDQELDTASGCESMSVTPIP